MNAASLPSLAQAFILYGVLPLWMLSGLADWLCHRHQRIEATSGLRESALHVLMLIELGTATLAAAFFHINALIVFILLSAFALHQLTLYIDLRYSMARREIPPIEQMVHSLLEYVPAIGGVLVLLLHWPAVLSLFGLGAETAEFRLRWKGPPLSAPALLGLGIAIAVLVLLPYLEELWRCWRYARRPTPPRA